MMGICGNIGGCLEAGNGGIQQIKHPSSFFPHSKEEVAAAPSANDGGRRARRVGGGKWLAWDGEALQSCSDLQGGNLGKKFTFWGQKAKKFSFFFLINHYFWWGRKQAPWKFMRFQ